MWVWVYVRCSVQVATGLGSTGFSLFPPLARCHLHLDSLDEALLTSVRGPLSALGKEIYCQVVGGRALISHYGKVEAHCVLPNKEGMSNAREYAGISNALFNTPDDHAQVAVWGVM